MRTRLAATGLSAPRFGGLFTDNPALMQAEDRYLAARAMPGTNPVADAPSSPLAEAAVRQWFATRALRAQSLAFLVNKYFEWGAKFHHGLYPNSDLLLDSEPGFNIFFGLYYTITGLHGLHVIIGMVLLSVWPSSRRLLIAVGFLLLTCSGLVGLRLRPLLGLAALSGLCLSIIV